MNQVIIDFILGLLAKVINPDMVKQYETEIIAWVTSELQLAPDLLHKLEEIVVCKLYSLSQGTSTTIDDQVVQIVAAALGIDTSKCPAPAPVPAP